jgi:hypothetical protein
MGVAVTAMAKNGLSTITVIAKSGFGSRSATAVINVSGGMP